MSSSFDMKYVASAPSPTGCSILVLLLIISRVESVVKFTSQYQGMTVKGLLGSSVNFTWNFSGVFDYITWGLKHAYYNTFETNGRLFSFDKNGKSQPLPVPSIYLGRVSGRFNGNATSGQVIFSLSNVSVAHERLYGCEIAPPGFGTIIFDFVKLMVEEAPAVIHLTSVNSSYNEGSYVTLSCSAAGKPDPDVMWLHNGQAKSSGTKTARLIFSKMRKDDAGIYTCAANNSAGRTEKYLNLVVNYTATIQNITSSVSKSWIGQTVVLTCISDGVPTPTITWTKRNGVEVKSVTAEKNMATVVMRADEDFGSYTCKTDNGVGDASIQRVQVEQIKAPGLPNIVSEDKDIQASSLTVKWTAPADDGGSPITAYRVVILQGGNMIRNTNITDPAAREIFIGGLKRNTDYNVKLYARNVAFEGEAIQKTFETQFRGVPLSAEIIELTAETIKWNEPQNNGAHITRYTVYRRTVRDDGTISPWNKVKDTPDVTVSHVALHLEKGKKYEFVVTATNKFGESFKEADKIRRIEVPDVPTAVKQEDIRYAEVTLQWDEPVNNGANITQYSIYQRIMGDEQWETLALITDVSNREYVVEVEEDKDYKFVVTARNEYGESPKGNIETLKMSEALNPPPETQADSLFGKDKLLHFIYLGVIAFLLVAVFTLVFVLWRMRRRLGNQKAERGRESTTGEEQIPMNPITHREETTAQASTEERKAEEPGYATPGGGDYMPLNPSTRSWELSREQVNVIKIIGKGAFSEVAKATVWNLRDNQRSITVAAKMLKANAPESDRKDLLSELELMTKLKPHAHVIKLVGCVTESDPLLVLIEYVPFGDLLGYLRKSRGLNDTYFKDPDVKPQTNLTAAQLMKFAWQVADGMCYLSSKKIIHRDLAARNVLVGEGEKCKVTDFGMARNVQQDDIYSRKSRGRLPVKWTAYEALVFGIYTTQSDVWSYGVLLYEILTVGGAPYPDINARQIAQKLQEGYRMPRPTHVDNKLYEIMLKCWEEQPTDRPSFAKLRKTMKDMEKHHKTYVNLNQYDNSLYANVKDLADE